MQKKQSLLQAAGDAFAPTRVSEVMAVQVDAVVSSGVATSIFINRHTNNYVLAV